MIATLAHTVAACERSEMHLAKPFSLLLVLVLVVLDVDSQLDRRDVHRIILKPDRSKKYYKKHIPQKAYVRGHHHHREHGHELQPHSTLSYEEIHNRYFRPKENRPQRNQNHLELRKPKPPQHNKEPQRHLQHVQPQSQEAMQAPSLYAKKPPQYDQTSSGSQIYAPFKNDDSWSPIDHHASTIVTQQNTYDYETSSQPSTKPKKKKSRRKPSTEKPSESSERYFTTQKPKPDEPQFFHHYYAFEEDDSLVKKKPRNKLVKTSYEVHEENEDSKPPRKGGVHVPPYTFFPTSESEFKLKDLGDVRYGKRTRSKEPVF